MEPILLNLDVSQLDKRLLWSPAQTTLAEDFDKLVQKCNRLAANSPLVLVTTEAETAHLVAAFNLASAFSFDEMTLVIDSTPKIQLVSHVLGIEGRQRSSAFSISDTLAVVEKVLLIRFGRIGKVISMG